MAVARQHEEIPYARPFTKVKELLTSPWIAIPSIKIEGQIMEPFPYKVGGTVDVPCGHCKAVCSKIGHSHLSHRYGVAE